MITQAINKKGECLYNFSWELETGEIHRVFLTRKKPIKRFGVVLNNELKKRGLGFYFDNPLKRASLSVLEKWDYERMQLEC
jgi:hypothetical protein